MIGDRGYVQLAEEHRIQDKYSIRCAPHIIGILRDTIDWADRWVETEINSSTDNGRTRARSYICGIASTTGPESPS